MKFHGGKSGGKRGNRFEGTETADYTDALGLGLLPRSLDAPLRFDPEIRRRKDAIAKEPSGIRGEASRESAEELGLRNSRNA